MKFDITSSPCKEIFVEGENINVTINTWANLEGATIMVHSEGPNLPLRMAGAFTWEELDIIAMAIAAARTV